MSEANHVDVPVADAQQSDLYTAISLWRAGRRISIVLAQRLMEDGYDVPSLERAYSRPVRV